MYHIQFIQRYRISVAAGRIDLHACTTHHLAETDVFVDSPLQVVTTLAMATRLLMVLSA